MILFRTLMLLTLLVIPLQAHSAPAADLVGKSVLVNWTESRQQRVNGSEVRAVTVGFQLQIYVSGAGRPFSRLTASSRGGNHGNEQVGAQGQSLSGEARSITVNGSTITLQANYGNYARNLRIDVAAGASGCNAQMAVGKESGSAPKAFKSGGRTIEIHSVSVSAISCSIRQGNVFGG